MSLSRFATEPASFRVFRIVTGRCGHSDRVFSWESALFGPTPHPIFDDPHLRLRFRCFRTVKPASVVAAVTFRDFRRSLRPHRPKPFISSVGGNRLTSGRNATCVSIMRYRWTKFK